MTSTCSAPTARHRQAATEVGYDRGYIHAAFTDACGGDPYAEPDVPDRFADIPTYYTAAYADGVDAYFDEHAEP
jgi:hypothetical protein